VGAISIAGAVAAAGHGKASASSNAHAGIVEKAHGLHLEQSPL
jgi:hypothetical protein